MKAAFTKLMFTAVAMLVATAAYAQNVHLASHTMFAELEQEEAGDEFAQIKARLASLEQGDTAGLPVAGDCCCDCWCNPCCGWVASAELMLLRPHDTEADSSTTNQYQTGSRITIGKIDECGRSWRARYYEYHHSNFNGGAIQQEMVDVEYAGRFRLGCNWHGELSAGVRWAEYFDTNNDYAATIGPVFGVEVRNEIWCDVDLFALYRHSLQFGEEGNEGHGLFGVTEMQLGAEVTRCVAGNSIFARVMLEAQEWSGVEDDDSEDLGLIGIGFAVGLDR